MTASNGNTRRQQPPTASSPSRKARRLLNSLPLGRLIARILFVAVVLILPATAQLATGDIIGTVSDQTGAVLPGARVTATDLATKESRSFTSNAVGEFTINLLKPGHYSLKVEQTGFSSDSVSDVEVGAGDRVRVDARLRPGVTTQTVEVTTNSPALHTDSATLGNVIDSEAVQDLPLNGRNFVTLAQLVPGATEGPRTGGNGDGDTRPSYFISVNGQSEALNNEMIDGMDNNDRLFGGVGVRPSIDAIAEINVQTNLYTAEAGRTGGAIIDLITKSGTNKLHGSIYEFIRNDLFDAKNYFQTVGRKPEFRQNQFGGSIGGPILRSKTFFFADYEGFRSVQGKTKTDTVPTLYEETHPGDFSDINGPVVASSSLNPIALKYFALYPAPNLSGASNNFVFAPITQQRIDGADLRIDHHFSDSDQVFARYSINDAYQINPGNLPAVNGIFPGGATQSPERIQNIAVNYLHVFSPRLILEAKLSYIRINIKSVVGNTGNLSQQFGLSNVNISNLTVGLAPQSISGYQGLGDQNFQPTTDLNNNYQESVSLSKSFGKQNLKFGGTIIRSQANQFQNPQGLGSWTYTNNPAGNAMLSFLEGLPYQVQRGNLLMVQDLRTWEPAVFVQDDWHLASWLTLNLGVRYSLQTPYTCADGCLTNFDFTNAVVLIAGQNGVSSTGNIKTDYSNIAPRFGFAATVRPGTVVRGGFGESFFQDDTGAGFYLKNPPVVYSYQPATLTTTLSTPLPPLAPQSSAQATLQGQLNGQQTNFKNADAMQFNLNVQQQFGGFVATLGYVGLQTRHQSLDYDTNAAIPAPCPTNNLTCYIAREPYASILPNVHGGIQIQASRGNTNYNGLIAEIEHRYSHGLTLGANFRWSHGLGVVKDFANRSQNEGAYAVPTQLGIEYGNNDLDVRDRFTMQAGYQIPFGKNFKGLAGAVVQGWQFNAIHVWETGLPFTVVNNSPLANTGASTGNDDRPNEVGPWKISHPGIHGWFNTAAFAAQPQGTIGNERRNALYGPRLVHLDVSMFKDFKIWESLVMQFRAEAFNVTNTASFSFPSATLGTGSIGTISSTVGTPRNLQFSLRLRF